MSEKRTRRHFLKIGAGTLFAAARLRRPATAAAAAAWQAPAILKAAAGKPTDVRVEGVTVAYEDYRYRTPLKFGGVATDRVKILNVECTIRNRQGKIGRGFGSIPMGNVWSFPSKTLTYDRTLGAMKAPATRVRDRLAAYREYGHRSTSPGRSKARSFATPTRSAATSASASRS